MIIMRFFSDFLYKGICCGYSFELHRQVDAIQMSTLNICLYKEVKKKYIGCNLKTMEFLDCALIGVCAVIRSNTVCNICLSISREIRKLSKLSVDKSALSFRLTKGPYLELWYGKD